MQLKEKDNLLLVETNVYQGRNGAVYLNWGDTVIELSKDAADNIARDIPDFEQESYNNHYL